jgi:hypothetical protein
VVNAEPGLIATIEAASPKSLNPLGGQGPKKYFAAVGVNTIRAVDDAITYLTERLKEEGVLIKATIKIDIDLSAAEATSLRERRDGKEVITTDQ